MTEKLPALSTQIATPSHNAAALVYNATLPQDVVQKDEPAGEDEPYTMKCICGFPDDDGYTIYCETCDTWQHIECYYPNHVADAMRDDFFHSCRDCKPRTLNVQQAIERQSAKFSTLDATQTLNQKPKRPPSKSHKKKIKPSDLQLNGHSPSSDTIKHSTSHDHPPPAKKPKSSHKPSQSISSQAAKRSPSYGTSRANPHGHPPSPATTPPDLPSDFEIHNYSTDFVSLCKEEDVQIVHTNSFANINISSRISTWLRDHSRLRQESGRNYDEVFQKFPSNRGPLKHQLELQIRKVPLTPGTMLRWQHLTTPVAVDDDVPLIELNGEIGLQADYYKDPDNRYDQLSCPLPFVFFHPTLPIYIDTRKEGSLARYVRRSCKPNAVLETYVSGGSEYHFWLVSEQPIAAHEQVTLGWDFRLPKDTRKRWYRLLGLDDDDSHAHEEQEMDELEYTNIAGYVHTLLSEYGGCACDLGSNCAFTRFHRNFIGKLHQRANPPKKKSRKPKANHGISPTSTGHATNSRAPSEGHADDNGEQDTRSTSESARSKPPSRDMTPAPRQGSFDMLGILTEPTDRDKRKVAMVEDSFRRLEQQPPKKKKRTSDGTGASGSGNSKPRSRTITTPAATVASSKTDRTYVDSGVGQSKSNSPTSAISPRTANLLPSSAPKPRPIPATSHNASVSSRPKYADAAVQTDPCQGEWYCEPTRTSYPKRRYLSLSQRLLANRHREKLEQEERRKRRESEMVQEASMMDIDDPNADSKASLVSPSSAQRGEQQSIIPSTGDIPMPDAPASSTNATRPSVAVNGNSAVTSPNKDKSPHLRVQMPPVPPFHSSSSNTVNTPLSASSIVQSPFATGLVSPFAPPTINGMAASPSPVKKKLSLSDYTKSRKAAAGRPPLGTTLLKSSSNLDEPKSATSVDAGASDSPVGEKAGDDSATMVHGTS